MDVFLQCPSKQTCGNRNQTPSQLFGAGTISLFQVCTAPGTRRPWLGLQGATRVQIIINNTVGTEATAHTMKFSWYPSTTSIATLNPSEWNFRHAMGKLKLRSQLSCPKPPNKPVGELILVLDPKPCTHPCMPHHLRAQDPDLTLSFSVHMAKL